MPETRVRSAIKSRPQSDLSKGIMQLLIALWHDVESAIWLTNFPLCEVDQTDKASRASAGRPRALAAFVLRLEVVIQ